MIGHREKQNSIAKTVNKANSAGMSANTISLDADMKAKLGECKPGDKKTFTVTVTVDDAKEGLKATVNEVAHYEKEPAKEKPSKGKRAKAVETAMMEEYA